jgi:hypothetical protein
VLNGSPLKAATVLRVGDTIDIGAVRLKVDRS